MKIFALSKDEVKKLIFSCTNLKHRTLLLTVYSAGLRVSEVVKLEPSHIERSRQMLRVEQGKGRKARYTLLSDQLLNALEEYWREYRPDKYLSNSITKSSEAGNFFEAFCNIRELLESKSIFPICYAILVQSL